MGVADGEAGRLATSTARRQEGRRRAGPVHHVHADRRTPQPAGPSPGRGGRSADWLRLVFGALLVVGLLWWLVGKAIDEPERFVEVTLIGFTNG